MQIRFYVEEETVEDNVLKFRAVSPTLSSEELWDRIVWHKEIVGKGDENGVFSPISGEAVLEILNDKEEIEVWRQMAQEIGADTITDLTMLAKEFVKTGELFMVKVVA